ncbi:MAG: Cro/CI family transcriptional regulator [Candidatus Arsenophonus phytopathogenicus]
MGIDFFNTNSNNKSRFWRKYGNLLINNFAKNFGQAKAAEKLGIYQSAVSKALRMRRRITVIIHDDGKVEAEEVKPFPSSNIKQKSN